MMTMLSMDLCGLLFNAVYKTKLNTNVDYCACESQMSLINLAVKNDVYTHCFWSNI